MPTRKEPYKPALEVIRRTLDMLILRAVPRACPIALALLRVFSVSSASPR